MYAAIFISSANLYFHFIISFFHTLIMIHLFYKLFVSLIPLIRLALQTAIINIVITDEPVHPLPHHVEM